MPLTTRRKPAEPDWHAINRGMNARQREVFNRFVCRLWKLADDAQFAIKAGSFELGIEEYEEGSRLADAEQRIIQLFDLINSIPWLDK